MKTRVLVLFSLCLALMLMASLAVLAESSIQDNLDVAGPDANGTYSFTATILDSNSAPISGKQVTMLVYNLGLDPVNNPDAPADGNIIGIDQSLSTGDGTVPFTFGTDANTDSGVYSVLVGGEEVNTAASTTFTIEEPASTVTFNLNYEGSTPIVTSAPSGTAVAAPSPEPIREGYTFGGWYTDIDCTSGNEYNFATIVTGDTELFAKWTVVPTGFTISGTVTGVGSAPITVTAIVNTIAVTGITVDQGTGAYLIPAQADGSVVSISIAKKGHITYNKDITITGDNATKDVVLIPGDTDNDGKIVLEDLMNVLNYWQAPIDETSTVADVDSDGMIVLEDLMAVLNYWQASYTD